MKKAPTAARRRLRRVLLIVLAVYFFGSASFTVVFFRLFFSRYDLSPDDPAVCYAQAAEGTYTRQDFTFPGPNGTLQGYLYPAENSAGIVVVVHGMHSCAEEHLPEILYFVSQGWTVMAFDGTGCGESEGAVSRGLPQMTRDLAAALDWLDAQPELRDMPTVLYGHSLGGYAVTAVLAIRQEIDAVVSIGGFNTPLGLMTATAERYVGPVCYSGWPFLAAENKLLFGDYADISAVAAINMSEAPVLLVRGSEDETIPEKCSIYSHTDEITRDNITLMEIDSPTRGRHTTTWLSEQAAALYPEVLDTLDTLEDRYGTPLPENIHDEYFASLDPDAVFELDEDFMAAVNDFYLDAIS